MYIDFGNCKLHITCNYIPSFWFSQGLIYSTSKRFVCLQPLLDCGVVCEV